MVEYEISDEKIVETVLEVLREQPDKSQYLASVGNRASSILGAPLKQILGGRKLRSVLETQIKDMLSFEGPPSEVLVRLSNSSHSDSPPIRFHSKFWAAFSKPIPPECTRWIVPTEPFNFEDRGEDYLPRPEQIEIGSELIPPNTLPRSERDAAIVFRVGTH